MPKKKTVTTTTTVVTEVEDTNLQKVTRAVLVVDRSGSMFGLREQAFTGINEQLAILRRDADKGGLTQVSYIQFDDMIDVVFENQNANTLKDITREQYEPRGGTAMYDAIGRAVSLLKAQTSTAEDTAYLVVVISDGFENASKEFTSASVAKLIKELKASGDWTFSMMLSNVDLSVATNLGVDRGNVAMFTSTAAGTQDAFQTIAAATSNYMAQRSVNTKSLVDFYSPVDNSPIPAVNNAITPDLFNAVSAAVARVGVRPQENTPTSK